MERIPLWRFETSDQGTFGIIKLDDAIIYTLELPWRDNRNDISCIPSGVYECRLTMSPRFKYHMYLVDPVKGRFGIRIHSANLAGDKKLGYKAQLNGCIALGLALGTIGNQKAVLLSKPAIRKLENFVNRKPFILEVHNGFR